MPAAVYEKLNSNSIVYIKCPETGELVAAKPIEGYEAYLATEHGKIYSTKIPHYKKRNGSKSQYLAGYDNGIGYKIVTLHGSDGGSKQKSIHRLIALAWVPRHHPSHIEVNHKDFDKHNNHPSNLEWFTHSKNLEHFWNSERGVGWKKNHAKRFRAMWKKGISSTHRQKLIAAMRLGNQRRWAKMSPAERRQQGMRWKAAQMRWLKGLTPEQRRAHHAKIGASVRAAYARKKAGSNLTPFLQV